MFLSWGLNCLQEEGWGYSSVVKGLPGVHDANGRVLALPLQK